jgi:hypothetical protein
MTKRKPRARNLANASCARLRLISKSQHGERYHPLRRAFSQDRHRGTLRLQSGGTGLPVTSRHRQRIHPTQTAQQQVAPLHHAFATKTSNRLHAFGRGMAQAMCFGRLHHRMGQRMLAAALQPSRQREQGLCVGRHVCSGIWRIDSTEVFYCG